MNVAPFRRCAVLLFLIMSTVAQAEESAHWFPNWLVGISGGYGNRVGNLTVRNIYHDGGSTPTPGAYIIRDLNDSGFIWGGLIGYQAICQEWLKGIEFSVDYHAISRSKAFAFRDPQDNLGYSGLMRYQRKWMIALTGRLGYAITPRFMPYLRAGAELGSDRLTTSFSSPALLDDFLVANETRDWVHRFLLGGGIEMPLVPACGTTLRIEYNFHSKGKTIKTEASIYDGVYNPTFFGQSQPYTQSMRLVLVWNFF